MAEATHYSKFALAPYGWPLYVWAHPRCGVCDLCCACGIRHPVKHRPCFSRCNTCGGREGAQDALDIAALVRFANLDEDDILHVSFENGVLGALPYFIARDAKTQSIVLSVRGTLSVADCITDLLYEPAGLDGTLLGSNEGIPPGSMAHNGVLGCARALHADLQKRGTLRDALEAPQHRGWTLIITGHSLGAGVATLLGLMLRSWRPELKVWAFSPPGGLVSENLAEAIKPWCTSVALGNDFISRLSMHNLERLRDEMMQCAALSKLPKFTVLRKAAISGPALRVRRDSHSQILHPPRLLRSPATCLCLMATPQQLITREYRKTPLIALFLHRVARTTGVGRHVLSERVRRALVSFHRGCGGDAPLPRKRRQPGPRGATQNHSEEAAASLSFCFAVLILVLR